MPGDPLHSAERQMVEEELAMLSAPFSKARRRFGFDRALTEADAGGACAGD
jgi:hypothetical protein